MRSVLRFAVLAVSIIQFQTATAQQLDSSLFSSALRWRLIGPFRAGRVTAVAGVPGQPTTFFIGTPGGGVWKTTDAGRVWQPIFDKVPISSIGALAVAPSDPNIVYVGTGEQLPGQGVYKSTDGGVSWSHAGLTSSRFIQGIIIDPRNPKIVIVAANNAGASIIWPKAPKYPFAEGSGIFKSVDGGQTWKKSFFKEDSLGVFDICSDPGNTRILYASLYTRASGSGDSLIPATSDILKSRDEGSTWQLLKSNGLPEKGRGRLGIAVAPGNGHRLYAIVNQGLFRSDDGGITWQRANSDPRIVGSEYFSRVFADPRNPDIVYLAQTSLYRSMDGGHTFSAFAGAPSGDDYHLVWIDPTNSANMLLGVDQGAVVSLDGGKTWSSWDNQPTGQFYHASTDNVFPYRVYAAQQDSGTAAVVSRSDYGQITASDWFSTAGFEDCHIAADPLNPNILYSGGWYGSVVRLDRTTGQVTPVFLSTAKYHTAHAAPLLFFPQDPHTLYFATQFVLKIGDGGRSWQEISPDLTLPEKDPAERAAINSLSPSSIQAGQIWAGTTNRLVHLTRDNGATWQNVSPPGLSEDSSILVVEASHHDPASAYLAIGEHYGFFSPYLLRTRDYGRTWTKIVDGLPSSDEARVIRDDPMRNGLLYCGTANGVFVSYDDGDHWQSLQLNLPPAPITDINVHQNDLVVSTFGRALWILDDITPLRDIKMGNVDSTAYLLPPEAAIRTHWDNYQDTPLTPEVPAGQNPPDGAIIDYYLKSAGNEKLTLSIYNGNGQLIRTYSSQQASDTLPPPNVPEYWFAPPAVLPRAAGLNRFVWDLRYPPPHALPYGYDGELLKYAEYTLADHAIPGETPRHQPQGPLVLPGTYTVELAVGGNKYRQPLTVTLDPRVQLSAADLASGHRLEIEITSGLATSDQAYKQAAALRAELADRLKTLTSTTGNKEAIEAAHALDKKIDDIQNGIRTAPGFGLVNRDLTRYIQSIGTADAAPSNAVRDAVEESCAALDADLDRWRALSSGAVPPAPACGTPAPKELLPPDSQRLLLEARGTGVQIYSCQLSNGKYAWTLKAPDAKLLNAHGEVIGKHFAGPTWESTDGTSVVGKVAANVISPDADSVPWLRLNAVSHEGSGLLAGVLSIQRLQTAGGKAPASGCDAEHEKAETSIPYEANYYFYGNPPAR